MFNPRTKSSSKATTRSQYDDLQFKLLFDAAFLTKAALRRCDVVYAVIERAGNDCGMLRYRDIDALDS